MTNELFVTGLVLVTLIIGAALLAAQTLLRPGRLAQCWIGLACGTASVLISVAHLHGNVEGISLIPPSLLASVSFLFGPLAGMVATGCWMVGLLFDGATSWFISAGTALTMCGFGSLMWLVRHRVRLNFWLVFFFFVVLTPLALTPWATLGNHRSGGAWQPLQVIPWRYAIGLILMCGGVGLIISRARTMQMLQMRERELVQALQAVGGGRWEWNVRTGQFFYHGGLYRDFGLDDSPDIEDATPLRRLEDSQQLVTLQACMHPRDLAALQPELERTLNGEAPYFHGQFRIRDMHGRWRWLVARGSAVKVDEHGRALRMSGMLLDVTEQHDMAAALQLSEVKYTTFYQTLPDPAGIVRIYDGKYMDVNPALERLLNLPAAEVVGRTASEFGLEVSLEDRTQLVQRLKTDGHVGGMSLQIKHRGITIPGLLSARSTHIESERCMVFVFHDMTQANAVQERLRSLIQIARQATSLARLGAWEGIPGQGVTFWSDVCCEIHGLPAGTPPPRDYVDRFVAPEWRDSVRELSRIEGRTEMLWDLEFEIIRTDHRRVWVRVLSEALSGTDGRPLKIRGILQDIDTLRRTSERMEASEARLAHIFNALPIPLCFVRQSNGLLVDINPAWEELLGYSHAECLGRSLVELGIYSEDTRHRMVNEATRTGQLVGFENELRTRSGTLLTVLQSLSSIDVDGQPCWLMSMLDITERKVQERLVREREAFLSLTISAATIGLWDWDLQRGLIRGDARWHDMQGHTATREDITSFLPWEQYVGDDHLEMIESALHLHLINPAVPFDSTSRISPPKGPTRWVRSVGKVVAFDESGQATRMLGVAMDVTLQREQQELLHHMAHYDALTGLPNRVLLMQRLREMIERSHSQDLHLAVAYIDLDALKSINDQLGHNAGDRLLVLVAGRLQRAMRAADCVGRLGGDEFVVLMADLNDRETCERRLRALMEAVSAPYELDGTQVQVTASVGYTLFPEDSADTDTLLRHADQAMYVSKQAGGNRLRAFDSVQESARQSLVEQRARFDQAMNNGELSLYLQPKVNLQSGAVVGAEALVRWVHPEHGVMLPGAFLHVIDGTELEAKFSDWLVDASLAQITRLQRQGIDMQISINIDAERLRHREFAKWVLSHLARYPDVLPRQLDLEITENAALYDVNHVAGELSQLRAVGVSVSLDDFGTGYSSLTYLRRLPIDQLKLDQSYVRGMMLVPADQAIVQGVIGLARSFGYRIVAEGVESLEQGVLLARMGCMIAQGHIISPPMPAEHFADWTAHWHAPEVWKVSARTMSEPIPIV